MELLLYLDRNLERKREMEFNSTLGNFFNDESTALPINDEEFLALLEEQGINTEEIAPVLRTSGKQMLLATAGSGKSTVLELKFARDRLLGCLASGNEKPEDVKKKVLITTFLASGADTMEIGLRKRMYDLGLGHLPLTDVSFANMHKEFLALLRLVGVKSEILTDTVANSNLKRRLLCSLCRKFKLGNSPEYPTNQELNTLESVISVYRNTIISEFRLTDTYDDAKDMGITIGLLPRIVQEYKVLRSRNDVIDFDDMIELVYTYFANPETRQPHLYDLYVSRYKYIMLDEFQDTSELQYCVLKPLFETCENVIVVGDDDQSIYSFRAANPLTLRWFEKDYKPTITPLTRSYRCPSTILMPIARVIDNNEGRFPKDIKAARQGGELGVKICKNISVMTDISLQEIDLALSKNKSIAVLSRTNYAYSPVMIHYILKYGGDFTVFGDSYNLDKARYKQVWQLVHLLEGRGLEALKSNLKVIDPGIKPWHVTNFERYMKNALTKDETVLTYLLEFAKEVSSRPLGMFVRAVESWINEGITDELELFKKILSYLVDKVNSSMVDSILTILTLASLSESLADFYQNKGYINNILKDNNRNPSNKTVIFSTPHGFKGKQADYVVVFNASEGIFPSSLSTELELPEERRNFFIVGTRAKERQVYLAMDGKVSRFVDELNVRTEVIQDDSLGIKIEKQRDALKEQLTDNTEVHQSDFLDFTLE